MNSSKNFKRILTFAAAVAVSGCVPHSVTAAETVTEEAFYDDIGSKGNDKPELPEGWLLWHNYSDYSALDSKLYLRSPDGTTEIIDGDFIHAMNGSFGDSPDKITFMAIDRKYDEWDIYIRENGIITNLTENSGYRNEDPKFSPDGKSIVFKRGHWDGNADDFVYDLALIDIGTREITMLTNDNVEEAMPCFSADGKYIYYAGYKDRIGSIYRLEIASGKSEAIFSESGVTAYYPVVNGDCLYFTKWCSADNRCDCIMRYDGSKTEPLPFDSENYDCSDACPIAGDKIIFSSTMNGSYDLFFYDGKNTVPVSELNTGKNELGADFFAYEENNVKGDVNGDGEFNVSDLAAFQKWLLNVPETFLDKPENADLCTDKKFDVFDMCVMRKELINKGNTAQNLC